MKLRSMAIPRTPNRPRCPTTLKQTVSENNSLLLHSIPRPTRHYASIPFAQMFKKPTPLEICVGVHDCIQICRTPAPIILDLLDLLLVAPLEHPVTRYVIPLLADILPDRLEDIPLVHADSLQNRDEVVRCKCAIRTAMCLAWPGERLCQQLLARVGGISPASAIAVSADITICVTNVVPVFFGELVVCHELEAPSPEYYALFQTQADAFQE